MDTSTVLDPPIKAKFYRWNHSSVDTAGNEAAKAAHDTWAPILEAAVTKLAAFKSPDELAQFFRDCGIQGRTGDSSRCAAAVWLQKETGHPQARIASTISIPHDAYGATTVVVAPQVVKDFYEIFDSCGYPDLHLRNSMGRLL